jgi:hypothetical protein
MKKYYLFAGLVLLAASPAFAQTKIGAAGAPDGSAMLEVTSGASNNKGLLLPKMTTVQRNAITSPASGLMIYNTTTNETQVNTGTPATPTWAVATATATGWNTAGNTGTTPATNFIGTTDNQPLTIRTNNTEQMRVTAAGYVGIGTTTPIAKLMVVDTGNTYMVVASSTAGSLNVSLGNGHHGMSRNLSSSGGGGNDVALYTTSGPASPGSLYLASKPAISDSIPLDQFVLKNTGYIGIGSSAPDVRLHVADTGDAAIRVGSTTSGKASVNLGLGNKFHGIVRNLTSSGGGVNDVALYTASGPSSPGSIHLAASPSATDNLNLTQFVLKNTGNVGIGTNAPTAKLHVNDGNITISNNGPISSSALSIISDNGGALNPDNISITSYGPSNPLLGFSTARGTEAAPLNSQAGDGIGQIVFGPRINGAFNAISGIASAYLGDGTTVKSRLSFVTSGLNAMIIDSSNNVGIGVTTPKVKLQVQGGILLRNDVNIAHGNGTFITWSTVRSGIGETEFINYRGTGTGGFRFYDVDPGASVDTAVDVPSLSGGNQIAFIAPGTGAYSALSDIRVKTNVNIINDGLEKVMAIRPVSYDLHTERTLKDGVVTFNKNDKTIKTIGFVAQELAKVVPEAVIIPKDPANEFYTVSYSIMIPVLTKAIQELKTQVDDLKAENSKLKSNQAVTAQLMERVKQMEQMIGIKEMKVLLK